MKLRNLARKTITKAADKLTKLDKKLEPKHAELDHIAANPDLTADQKIKAMTKYVNKEIKRIVEEQSCSK
jgi:hypothetical protein